MSLQFGQDGPTAPWDLLDAVGLRHARAYYLVPCLVLMNNWQTSSWSITPMGGGGALRHATCDRACQVDF